MGKAAQQGLADRFPGLDHTPFGAPLHQHQRTRQVQAPAGVAAVEQGSVHLGSRVARQVLPLPGLATFDANAQQFGLRLLQRLVEQAQADFRIQLLAPQHDQARASGQATAVALQPVVDETAMIGLPRLLAKSFDGLGEAGRQADPFPRYLASGRRGERLLASQALADPCQQALAIEQQIGRFQLGPGEHLLHMQIQRLFDAGWQFQQRGRL